MAVSPYGLLPYNLIGGQPYAGSLRSMPIVSGFATPIFLGDVVRRDSTGFLVKDTGTTTATPVGVFQGVKYTDPVRGMLYLPYYPGNVVASDITALVADDYDLTFKIVVVSAGTTTSTLTISAVMNNAALVQNAGSTTNGASRVALLASSVATTNTLPLRIIDVVPESATTPGNYSEVIVKWTAGMHQYANPTGV